MDLDILDRFTTHLRNTLSRSIDLAWELQHERIPPLFLLVGLCEQQGSIGSDLLRRSHISLDTLEGRLQRMRTQRKQPATTDGKRVGFLWPEFSAHTKKMIERATALSLEHGHQYIGTEHLLLAMVEKPDQTVQNIFTEKKVVTETLKEQLMTVMSGTSKFTEMQNVFSQNDHPQTVGGQSHGSSQQGGATAATHDHTHEHDDASETPALDYFSVDLTSEQQTKKLNPVIGRDKEIDRMINILSRRSKNNPLLMGEPGVGKTAIVEGLARRITEGNVPDILLNKRVVALDLGMVLAGTMYRGEFESRFKQLTEELRSHPNIILFIDEIHTIVGAGGVSGGTLDAANLLKPALARGDLRCIGATTADEFRKHIESDPALERRFQPVLVEEPSEEDTVAMLKGLRGGLEEFHHVTIPDAVLVAAVQLSTRYIPDRRLPDKAIDLIDEAGAKAHVQRATPAAVKKLQSLRAQLTKLRQEKKQAVRTERYQHAVDIKQREKTINDAIAALEATATVQTSPKTVLKIEDIAHVISISTGVPMQHLLAAQNREVHDATKTLQQHIIGQDAAVRSVASAIKRAYAGLTSPHRPVASFLFLGPSGVGKTLLAKTIAAEVFHDSKALIRLDMSEFAEGFTVSKLIGAPAGYVGHKEGVKFIDHVRRKPYSVVLFDEIEKAHPDIFNLLLQLLDEGRLTDSTGREINFRNTIVVLTSNVGMDVFTKQAELGFAQDAPVKKESPADLENTILADVQNTFPAEFLNRIDQLIAFTPLTLKHVERIVDLHWKQIHARLAARGYNVTLTPAARTLIAKKSFKPEEGARRVAKTLTDLIENPLADTIVNGHMPAGSSLQITRDGEKIAISKKAPKRPR